MSPVYDACSFALGRGEYCKGDTRLPATHSTRCPGYRAGVNAQGLGGEIPATGTGEAVSHSFTRHAFVNAVRTVHGDAAAARLLADLNKPGPRRLFPDDSAFEAYPEPSAEEARQGADAAEARETRHREGLS